MKKLLLEIINWSIINHCICADFQISNTKLSKILISCNFKLQNNSKSSLTNLTAIFNPFYFSSNNINAFWKIKINNKIFTINQSNTHFVKSDNDMDRPIIL